MLLPGHNAASRSITAVVSNRTSFSATHRLRVACTSASTPTSVATSGRKPSLSAPSKTCPDAPAYSSTTEGITGNHEPRTVMKQRAHEVLGDGRVRHFHGLPTDTSGAGDTVLPPPLLLVLLPLSMQDWIEQHRVRLPPGPLQPATPVIQQYQARRCVVSCGADAPIMLRPRTQRRQRRRPPAQLSARPRPGWCRRRRHRHRHRRRRRGKRWRRRCRWRTRRRHGVGTGVGGDVGGAIGTCRVNFQTSFNDLQGRDRSP